MVNLKNLGYAVVTVTSAVTCFWSHLTWDQEARWANDGPVAMPYNETIAKQCIGTYSFFANSGVLPPKVVRSEDVLSCRQSLA